MLDLTSKAKMSPSELQGDFAKSVIYEELDLLLQVAKLRVALAKAEDQLNSHRVKNQEYFHG